MFSIFVMTLFIAILLLVHMEAAWYMYIAAIVVWGFRVWYNSSQFEEVLERLKG